MTRFKKGTKVVCVDSLGQESDLKLGGIYISDGEVPSAPDKMYILRDKTGWFLTRRFIPVSEIEPFAVIAENWDQCREIIAYWRSIFEGCPTELQFEKVGGMKQVVGRNKVVMYCRTNLKGGYAWDSDYLTNYHDGTKRLTFEQFKNNEHIMNTKLTPNDCCGVSNLLDVSPEFIKEAHKAACPDWKKRIEKEFPSLFPEITFSFGDKLKLSGRTYIIAAINDSEYILINIENGSHWGKSFKPKDGYKITELEIKSAWMNYQNLPLVKI